MEPTHHHLNLCTFAVPTHLGLQRRLGAHKQGRVLDLNYATAWYMAQAGEPEPQRLADALVPADMLDFLRSGLRAAFTAEELFLGSGPHPADWWLRDPPPRGPNEETLVYDSSTVRLLGVFGWEEKVSGPVDCGWELAAVIAAQQFLAGYALAVRYRNRAFLGPFLVSPNTLREAAGVEWNARVNGVEQCRGTISRNLELDDPALRPGDFVSTGPLGSASLVAGDVLEVEADKIGILRLDVA